MVATAKALRQTTATMPASCPTPVPSGDRNCGKSAVKKAMALGLLAATVKPPANSLRAGSGRLWVLSERLTRRAALRQSWMST
ncbi:hypothetical protein EV657_11135 [Rhodovulum visakhapatnamense]|uniref:Uncharacterized protein n=1 Tax=Rhodovulum visakhapatnamense TaxID=364297 RepID=A0A4R8G0I1_9RHOB|nr:hypothetical protein EV657_11135 [Rhodovulum visakhapatnamense]